MTINGHWIDTTKLWTKDAVLAYMRVNGANDRVLADVRSDYQRVFGDELTWRYPLSEGCYAGCAIVAVQEGFLCLPYDEMDKEDYEIFSLSGAKMMVGSMPAELIKNWASFASDLLVALCDMQKICNSKMSTSTAVATETDGRKTQA